MYTRLAARLHTSFSPVAFILQALIQRLAEAKAAELEAADGTGG
jgi:hypothetical protein